MSAHTPTALKSQVYDPNGTGYIDHEILRGIFENLGYGEITDEDLDVLVDRLSNRHPELPAPPLPPTVLVGHHTTLVGLARDLQLEPSVLNPRNLAAGLALVRDPTQPHGWRVVAHWPGRPS